VQCIWCAATVQVRMGRESRSENRKKRVRPAPEDLLGVCNWSSGSVRWHPAAQVMPTFFATYILCPRLCVLQLGAPTILYSENKSVSQSCDVVCFAVCAAVCVAICAAVSFPCFFTYRHRVCEKQIVAVWCSVVQCVL